MSATASDLTQLAAKASMRADQAENVARTVRYTDPDMFAYAVSEMRRERAEARQLFARASEIADAEGGASGRLVCYGACKQHDGEVRKVRVLSIKTGHDWGALNYCAAAIAEDESRGLTVVEEGGAQ